MASKKSNARGVIVFTYCESNFYDSCDHEKSKTADACIADIIGQKNPEHFFLATQDNDLRKKFQEVSLFCILSDAMPIRCFMF